MRAIEGEIGYPNLTAVIYVRDQILPTISHSKEKDPFQKQKAYNNHKIPTQS